jgi:hypothetical protein
MRHSECVRGTGLNRNNIADVATIHSFVQPSERYGGTKVSNSEFVKVLFIKYVEIMNMNNFSA